MAAQTRPKGPRSSARLTANPKAGKASTPMTTVGKVRKSFNMRRSEFTRLLGLSERRLADLETGKAEPTDAVRRRITEVDRLCRELSTVVDKAVIGAWMNEPNPAFGGLKPLEVAERGESDQLWRMIYELKSGTPG